MVAKRLYLARHGTLGADAARKFIGTTDVPLSPEGERQAEWLRTVLAGEDVRSVHCSDLLRCRQTAERIAGGRNLAVHRCKALREVAMGEWDGRPRSEIAAEFPDAFKARGADIADYRVPGGESMADCRDRVVAAIAGLVEASPGNLLVVAHAAVNRLFLCHVLGIPLHNMFKIGQDPGCLNIVRCDGTGYRVILANFSPAALAVSGDPLHGADHAAEA